MSEQTRLSPIQVTQWFRDQAEKYTRLAEEIEQDFGLTNGRPQSTLRTPAPRFTEDNLEIVRDFLKKSGARRAAEISRETGISEHEVRAMAESDDTSIKLGERGWISYAPSISGEIRSR